MNITTTNELKNEWRHTIEGDGGHCPVCDRWGKVYARAINKTMAQALIWLCHNAGENRWVDVPLTAPHWLVRSNQLSTLRWWGLVEKKENDNPKNKSSGIWRATQLGFDFVTSKVQVPKKVFTYNGDVEGASRDMVYIGDCFFDTFDYQEVMNNRGNN